MTYTFAVFDRVKTETERLRGVHETKRFQGVVGRTYGPGEAVMNP